MMKRLQLHRIIASLAVIVVTSMVYGLLHPVLAIGPGTGAVRFESAMKG